jgi:3-oxoacyl-[acyl-carrier protein] reductase
MQKRTRLALVTGGGSGIGYAISRSLVAQGYSLIVHHNMSSRRITELARLAKNKKVTINVLAADFTDVAQLAACAQHASSLARAAGGIDAVIFCAGVNEKKQYSELTADDYERVFSVNSKAPLLITQKLLAVRAFKKNAAIVNIGSPNGFIGGSSRNMLYTMSKTSLHGFTRNLAKMLAPHIRVNCVVPGFIKTRMLLENTDAKELARKKARIPAGRFGTPEEVARVVCFLVSEEASYVTGQIVHVNGGVFFG